MIEQKIFVTSDWHFSHNKDFIYEPRGFETVEEMNKAIIKNFNSVVNENDLTFVLGDLCLGGAGQEILEKSKQLIEQLNGSLFVILGNHDQSNPRKEMYNECKNIVSIQDAKFYKYKQYNFFLSHFPTLVSNWDNDKPLKQRTICLCGHSHTQNRWADWDKGPIYHCELDAHNNYPILLDDILQEMKEKYPLDKTAK